MIFSKGYSPFPFLTFLDGEGEDALEKKKKDRCRKIPIVEVLFEDGDLPDGQEAVAAEHQPGEDGLDGRHQLGHRLVVDCLPATDGWMDLTGADDNPFSMQIPTACIPA
jgi:hypothetical protein